jgi:hypothetical protein
MEQVNFIAKLCGETQQAILFCVDANAVKLLPNLAPELKGLLLRLKRTSSLPYHSTS